MYFDLCATLEFRQESVSMSQRSKSERIKLMEDRILDGEFWGSAWHALQSPTTAGVGITHGEINYQMTKIDPVAHAARAHDRARVAAETAAAEENGHVVGLVFVKRGGSSSAKKALADITQKWEGMCLHLEFQKI